MRDSPARRIMVPRPAHRDNGSQSAIEGRSRPADKELAMEGHRFDDVARSVVAARLSRRQPIRWLLGAPLGGMTGLVGLQPASAACRAKNKRCSSRSECCSGICKKKRRQDRNKVCRPSPQQGTCTVEQDACQGTSSICNDDPACNCQIRVNGSSVCARKGACFNCETDSDCPAENFGEGAMCVRCAVCGATNNRGCVGRCPTQL